MSASDGAGGRARDPASASGPDRRRPRRRAAHHRLPPRAARADRPLVASIWRILHHHGLITPQPQKRPRSSFIRFEAALPNELWQGDVTHWALAGGTTVEILDLVDDHSRLAPASVAFPTVKAADDLHNVYNGFEMILIALGCWHVTDVFLDDA